VSGYREQLPLTVLTGFLGSGKTSLLNRWLKSPLLADAAVLINEFGEIGLDHQLVEAVEGAPVLLANGCVCCSIRDDLKSAILKLDERRRTGEVPPYRRILIETTGLADPAPIVATLLNDPELRHHYRLGAVITTVDAVNGPTDVATREEARRQVALADHLVITKTDLVTPAVLAGVREQLLGVNPRAGIVDVGAADAALLRAVDVYDPAALPADVARWLAGASHSATHAHGMPYDSIGVTVDEAIDWTAFGLWLTMLLHVHGTRILRVKGLLNVAGSDTPVVVNGVQHLVHPPFHLARWPDADRRSRLVFITEGLAPEALSASLAVFNRLGAALRPAMDSSA
jgi:G3E family GTPase